VDYETKQVHVNLPEFMVDQSDLVAALNVKDRTDIIIEALDEYLEKARNNEKFMERAVELYLEDEIDFDLLKEFVGRVEAESVRASKDIYDRGDKIAGDIAREAPDTVSEE